jgi:apolipoprotein D and lipocalin family protein
MTAKKQRHIMKRLLLLVPLLLPGCGGGIPEGIVPVQGFDIERYVGTWYEIARLDHSFERGLERVSARYSLRDDGGVNVINRGFDPRKKRWKEAAGKAYFVGNPQTGRLKVSFFGPFYGGYNIIALDETGYSYAMICGPSRSYLWILSREPRLEEPVLSGLIRSAEALGFETDGLIRVRHGEEE